MVKTYVKKPVKIEAIKYRGFNLKEVLVFLGQIDNIRYEGPKLGEYERLKQITNIYDNGLFIDTNHGKTEVSIGDYVIKGIDGEFYPCSDDVFNKTYSLCE